MKKNRVEKPKRKLIEIEKIKNKILKNNVLIITFPGGGWGAVAGGWEGRALSL